MANFQYLINIEELIAKYLRDELSEQENEALQEWINASPANKAKFEELTNADRLIEKMRVLEEGRSGKDLGWRRIEQRLEGRPVKLWFRLQWTKVAATLLLLILGMGVWFMLRPRKNNKEVAQVVTPSTSQPTDVSPGGFKAKLTLSDGTSVVLDSVMTGKIISQGNMTVANRVGVLTYTPSTGGGRGEAGGASMYNTLTTSNGQTYKAILSDGSTVWLNSASSIRYPVSFTGNERRVEITGEVYFEVAHLTPRTGTGSPRKVPFIVRFDSPLGVGGEVIVLGTKFNINAYRDETMVRTTLLEGRVKIIPPGSGSQAILKPGQQAQITIGDKAITITSEVDMEEVLAWKDGKFVFNNTELEVIMRQIKRWYNVDVSYEGNVLQQEFTLTGEISRYNNVSQVLELLETTRFLHFTIEGKKITVKH